MALQQNIIQNLMRTLNHTTNSNATQLLDAAVASCQGTYSTINQVIEDCVSKCSTSSNYTEFLKKHCGIDLDNEDTGALVGFDACGYSVESAESIIPEKDISEWKMPDTETVMYGKLKVRYPSFSGLSTEQQFIVGALHTWWIPRALYLISLSFGYEFNSSGATPRTIEVEFTSEPVSLMAHVDWLYDPSTGKTVQLFLRVNMAVYNTILTTNPNGVTSTYGTSIPYLDRIIAHEFVHAVEASNIDYFWNLANDYPWFVEGSSELVHGIDDIRRADIIALASDPTRFKNAFTSSPATATDKYSAGYILLRFFAKKVADFYNIEYAPARHLMAEKGTVYSLKGVGEKFLEFAQRSNRGVSSWELVDDRLSSFYGATLRVPMRRWHDKASDDKYYLYTSKILQKHTGVTYPNFIDILKNKYQLATFTENYSMSSIDSVVSAISSASLDDKSHVMFSGCELSLAGGDSPYSVLTKVKNIVNTVNSAGARPSLFITPITSVYSGGVIIDSYRQLLRNSIISRRINMVCLGDSITDFYGGWSWTTYCQEEIPNMYVINKGVSGNKTQDALARFNTDVLEQLPDVCFILIGCNDLWDAGTTEMANAKANWKQMVDSCIANNIVPIIGLYKPTLEQIEAFVPAWIPTTPKTPAEILWNFNEYCQYCSEIAEQYGLLTVDVFNDLKNLNSSIDLSCVIADKYHLSLKGAQKMGKYIASQIKDFIWDRQEKLHQEYDIVNIYDIFCKKLGVTELTQSDLESLLCSAKVHYSDGDAMDYISEFIFSNELLVPFNCPYFYVSLQHMNIDEDTYSNWLRTGIDLEDNEEYSAHDKDSEDEYSDFKTKIYYQSEKYNHSTVMSSKTRFVLGKYGGNNEENAFRNEGEFIAVGLHTLFDRDLWMCEQGQITCAKEAMEQINDLNLLPWESHTVPYSGGREDIDGEVDLPVFPGTGCPWFTVSEDNKEQFGVSKYGIDYWFTKSDYDATITIRFSNKGHDCDVYQSISLGMMTNVACESYMFPLYVAGGNQALSQDVYVYTPPYGNEPVNKIGNIYDLDIQNICFSNSNLLFPTKFNEANMSNFRVLSPAGEWKDIYGYTQEAELKPYPTCSNKTSNWGNVLKEVEQINIYNNSVYPFWTFCHHKIDLYTIDKHKRLNQYEHSSVLNRIVVGITGESTIEEADDAKEWESGETYLESQLVTVNGILYKSKLDHTSGLDFQSDIANWEIVYANCESGVEGVLPNCYSSWYRTLPAGEVIIEGKKFLSVPNGWENRLWHYPTFLGMYSDEEYWKNDKVRETWDDLHNPLKNNMIVDRLLIPLEEGD